MMNFMMSDKCKAAMEIPYVLTDEVRNALEIEIATRLDYFDGLYHPNYDAICKMLGRCMKAKSDLIRLFEQSPFYNGNFQIVFPAEYTRGIDYNAVYRYLDDFYDHCYARQNKAPEANFGTYTFYEVSNMLDNIREKLQVMNECETLNIPVDRNYLQGLKESEKVASEIYNKIYNKVYYEESNKYVVRRGRAIEMETYNKYVYWINSVGYLRSIYKTLDKTITKEIADILMRDYPGATTGKNKSERTIATEGQKLSRVIARMAKETGFDQTPLGDNAHFIQFADAINPLNVTKWTVLSVHPLDFYNMSYGNGWRSCHTIDKRNKDNSTGDHYSGMYSGGTGSYMEDGVSFVFYTADHKKYPDNTHLETAEKTSRCMFHIGENMLIQGRMYPQGMDGATDKYKETREIVQRVIAECLGVPNSWKVVKGTDECGSRIISLGCHYRDYLNFSDCNVSYLKNGDRLANANPPKIKVGSNHTCPSCGRRHNTQGWIECNSCANGGDLARERNRAMWLNVTDDDSSPDEVECANCGCFVNANDAREINSEYYCEDCCFYCDYHGEWEVRNGNEHHVENTNVDICDNAFDWGNYSYCQHCNNLIDTSQGDVIYIDDIGYFCDSDCANEDGWVYCSDGEYHHEDYVYSCERCGAYVFEDDDDRICTEDGNDYCCRSCAIADGYVECGDNEWRRREDCEQCQDDEEYYERETMVQTPDGKWWRSAEVAVRHGYTETDVEQGVA